jgi:hypothetical protein
MNALAWILIGLFGFSAIASILNIGQPRKPTTPGVATVVVLVDAVLIASILAWYPR